MYEIYFAFGLPVRANIRSGRAAVRRCPDRRALVFPGVFSVDANPVLGVVGAAVAGGLAWKKCPIIVCVLAAVAVEAVMLLVQGSGMLWSVVVVAG